MMTIHLKELHFYANHGWHENEAIVGNEFVVSLAIKIDLKKPVTHLEDTVDYVSAYNIVKKYFTIPHKLLETLAERIVDEIYATDNRINSINIIIDKINAPIPNFTGRVGIEYLKSFT